MKKTLKEFLAFFGVKEGDIIVFNGNKYVIHLTGNNIPTLGADLPLQVLVDEEYKIITPTKIGDLSCREYARCEDCPLGYLDCIAVSEDDTLYECLDKIFDGNKNNPLYKFMKKDLDKDVDPKSK